MLIFDVVKSVLVRHVDIAIAQQCGGVLFQNKIRKMILNICLQNFKIRSIMSCTVTSVVATKDSVYKHFTTVQVYNPITTFNLQYLNSEDTLLSHYLRTSSDEYVLCCIPVECF